MTNIIVALVVLLLSFSVAAEPAPESATKTLVWPDGTRYVGVVKDGKRSGKGTIFWQDGTRFVGQFENDMRNGPGTMILPDGTVYTGYFKDDELIDTPEAIAAADIASSSGPRDSIEIPEPEAPVAEKEQPDQQVVEQKPIEPDTAIQAQQEQQITPEQAATSTSTKTSTKPDVATADIAAPELAGQQSEPMATLAGPITSVSDLVKEQLIDSIDLWASAWTDQNVSQYLASYAEDFNVPGNQSRKQWEALRWSRLKRPKYINVKIVYEEFKLLRPNVVEVRCKQAYRSDIYSDDNHKVLEMKYENSEWKIIRERSF